MDMYLLNRKKVQLNEEGQASTATCILEQDSFDEIQCRTIPLLAIRGPSHRLELFKNDRCTEIFRSGS